MAQEALSMTLEESLEGMNALHLAVLHEVQGKVFSLRDHGHRADLSPLRGA